MELKGTVQDIIYKNETNGYTIATFDMESADTTIVGYLPFVQGSNKGVSFISSYDREKSRSITIMSNFAQDVWTLHGNFYKALSQSF